MYLSDESLYTNQQTDPNAFYSQRVLANPHVDNGFKEYRPAPHMRQAEMDAYASIKSLRP